MTELIEKIARKNELCTDGEEIVKGMMLIEKIKLYLKQLEIVKKLKEKMSKLVRKSKKAETKLNNAMIILQILHQCEYEGNAFCGDFKCESEDKEDESDD